MTVATLQTRDRLSFTLFLTIALHAAFILGVGFSSELNMPDSPSIEVTLSLTDDKVKPDEADFMAEKNQIGSGSEAEVMEMTTTEQADFHSNEFSEVSSQQTPVAQVEESSREMLTTEAASEDEASKDQQDAAELIETMTTAQMDRERLVEEIASLEARIAADQQALAKMPRTKRISSVSTKSASEAAYLNMWREKCERIGRRNYPPGQLEGNVLMLVSIFSDGTLEEVQILRSSGHRDLDRAALSTVRQAAPYQPFNVDMRKSYDRLEFTRTWQFTRSGSEITL